MGEPNCDLLILGASTRAAAFSARRAGLAPVCGDLFADADLAACCPVTKADDYPVDLEKIARSNPPGPWMYTGGLENYPTLVERISRIRPLYGNAAAVLRKVRNPELVFRTLTDARIDVPEVRMSAEGLPPDGSWLCKRLRSSGGLHVWPWRGNETESEIRGVYFQRRIEGTPCGAVFVGCQGLARLLGITEQLQGNAWSAPTPFGYAGSVGPLPRNNVMEAAFERIGSALCAAFDVQGIFGVDAVVAKDQVWPVEVNPRYTASVEVLERAFDVPFLDCHVLACQGDIAGTHSRFETGRCCGKAILYSRSDVQVTSAWTESVLRQNVEQVWPGVADIPNAGTIIHARQPVATVFATGSSREEVVRSLREQLGTLKQTLWDG